MPLACLRHCLPSHAEWLRAWQTRRGTEQTQAAATRYTTRGVGGAARRVVALPGEGRGTTVGSWLAVAGGRLRGSTGRCTCAPPPLPRRCPTRVSGSGRRVPVSMMPWPSLLLVHTSAPPPSPPPGRLSREPVTRTLMRIDSEPQGSPPGGALCMHACILPGCLTVLPGRLTAVACWTVARWMDPRATAGDPPHRPGAQARAPACPSLHPPTTHTH